MSNFDLPLSVLAPLSKERILARLEANGANCGPDEDGDIGGIWDSHLFYFFVGGENSEILQLRGRWNRQVNQSQYQRLLELANQVNTEQLFPKAYVRLEDGEVGLYAEHTVDYEPGVSDEQLDLHLAAGIGSSLQFFAEVDKLYPAEAAAVKAEFEEYEQE